VPPAAGGDGGPSAAGSCELNAERGAYWPTAAGTAAMLASMPTITTIATTIMSMRANRDPGIAAYR
jgi:hypothetical protein